MVKQLTTNQSFAGSNPVTLVWSEVYTDIKLIKNEKMCSVLLSKLERETAYYVSPCSLLAFMPLLTKLVKSAGLDPVPVMG